MVRVVLLLLLMLLFLCLTCGAVHYPRLREEYDHVEHSKGVCFMQNERLKQQQEEVKVPEVCIGSMKAVLVGSFASIGTHCPVSDFRSWTMWSKKLLRLSWKRSWTIGNARLKSQKAPSKR